MELNEIRNHLYRNDSNTINILNEIRNDLYRNDSSTINILNEIRNYLYTNDSNTINMSSQVVKSKVEDLQKKHYFSFLNQSRIVYYPYPTSNILIILQLFGFSNNKLVDSIRILFN